MRQALEAGALLAGAVLLSSCAAHGARGASRCPLPDGLRVGMTQVEVGRTPGFETPTIFGAAHASSTGDVHGIYAVSLQAGRSIPRDAPEVAWLYPQSEHNRTWVLVEFENYRLTRVLCARIVRADEVR